MSPRLDRGGQAFPWVQSHFSMFRRRGKSPVGPVEGVVACSRVVNGGSSRLGLRAGTAAETAPWRRGVGGACSRAGVTGPAWAVGSSGARSIGVIGNGVESGRWQRQPRRQPWQQWWQRQQLTRGRQPRQQWRPRQQQQLTRRRGARVSAQGRAARIFASGCARGRVAMSRSGCSTRRRAGVFAVWRAAWRCGECWTASRGSGRGVGVGGVNGCEGVVSARTRREACLCRWSPGPRQLRLARPQPGGRSGRAGTCFLSPVSFLRAGPTGRVRSWSGATARSCR